jgi:hypothetical protein
VSRNAIKHGILAREVVITGGEGEERLKEFHDLVEKICEQYKPVGVIEESLVQTIATCWWRKARVLRAENGEIRTRLDGASNDQRIRNEDKANLGRALTQMEGLSVFPTAKRPEQKLSSNDHWSAMQVAQSDLRSHFTGILVLQRILNIAKLEITKRGSISEFTRREIFDSFCFWDSELANECRLLCTPKTTMAGQQSEEIVDQQTNEERFLLVGLIDHRLHWLGELEQYARDREKLAIDAQARSFSLPPADATDKLLRYETHLDKQLYRAMDQLERLQRQRRGETVPPPLNINLGRGR